MAITVIVFVDALGFALVLPFLPLYARRSFGASSLVVGAVVATFGFFQLFSAPFLGRFSDRYGRRPALIITLLGSGLGFLVLASAQWVRDGLASAGVTWAPLVGLGLLFLGRAINGAAGGNMPVAQAYLADLTDPEERAHALGHVTTAFALALGVGPVLSGYLAHGGSFTIPALVGTATAALAAVFAWYALPESRDRPAAAPTARTMPRMPTRAVVRERLSAIGAAGHQRSVRGLLAMWFLFILCFAMTAPMFPLIAGEDLHMTTRAIGNVLALLALLAILWQGFIMKPLSARLSDRQLAAFGLACFLGCYLLVWHTNKVDLELSKASLGAVVLLFGLGWAAARPAITSALTKVGGNGESGAVLGVAQSVDSLATVIGPVLMGAVHQTFGLQAVGLIAALFSAMALLAGRWEARQPQA
jgi:MFS transporter, DHA1 family, tetracycline resistance protein